MTTQSEAEAEAHARLGRLFENHADAVFRYASFRLPHQEAQEIVSDVFVTAWRRLNQIPEYERPWLLGVARKMIANRLRSSQRQNALADKVAFNTPTAVPDLADSVGTQSEVEWVLDQMRPKDQDLLRLLMVEDFSTAELAMAFGCTRGTVSTRVRRAKQRFAEIYKAADHPDRREHLTVVPSQAVA